MEKLNQDQLDQSRNVEKDIIILKTKFNDIENRLETIFKGETKTYQSMKNFVSVMTAILAVIAVFFGYVNFSNNASQVKSAIENAEEHEKIFEQEIVDKTNNSIGQIQFSFAQLKKEQESFLAETKSKTDEIFKDNGIDRAEIYPIGGEDNTVIAEGGVEKDNIDNSDKIRYDQRLFLSFYLKSFRDDSKFGNGRMLEIFARFDGDFAKVIATNNGKTDNVLAEKLRSGQLYEAGQSNSGIDVPVGYKALYTLPVDIVKKSCEELSSTMGEMINNNSVGYIYITPVFSKIKEIPAEKRFRIKVAGDVALFSCKELQGVARSNNK